MCGIYGMIGDHKKRADILSWLCHLNADRGHHSAGIAAGEEIFKRAVDPTRFCMYRRFEELAAKPGITLGHTRWATIGKINKRNAHPFRFGRTIGTHNGVVHNFHKLQAMCRSQGAPIFQVDSEALIWLLENTGEIHPAEGSLNVAYHQCDGILRLIRADNPLSVAFIDGAIVYSSEYYDLDFTFEHLKIKATVCELQDCHTYTITPDLNIREDKLGYDPSPAYYTSKGVSHLQYDRSAAWSTEASESENDNESDWWRGCEILSGRDEE